VATRAQAPRGPAPQPRTGGVVKVAVVAHAGKRLDGGLPELRRALAAQGVVDPLWYEVPKAKRAPEQVRRALGEGAELIFAWGGDGMVRRCVGELAGEDAHLAVLPAGTANLFAANLGIPRDIEAAVAVGLRGARRRLDVGRLEDERFAVMAGVGFDAAMIRGADDLKARVGRAAYLWSGTRSLKQEAFEAEIAVDGADWYAGHATCVLLGNVGELFGGVEVFPDAEPDDGRLEVGVATAEGIVQWARTLARTVAGDPARSPFVRVTKAKAVEVRLDRKVRYELDGGDRKKIKAFEATVEPGALALRVPRGARQGGTT
jgi:YegS/Rv2252/BmrU family lipid kinase